MNKVRGMMKQAKDSRLLVNSEASNIADGQVVNTSFLGKNTQPGNLRHG